MLTTIRLLQGVFALLAIAGIGLPSRVPENKQSTHGSVSFRIIAPQSTVCRGSSIDIEVELRNIAQEVLLLQPRGIDGTHFRTERRVPGAELPDFASLDRELDPFPSEKPVESVVLKAGESYRYTLSLSLTDEFFKSEGFYKLRLDYDGRLHPSPPAHADAPKRFEGHLESNWLIFEVEECPR